MTFLELCQDVHRQLALDSNAPGSLPTTTTAQVGTLGQIVQIVNEVYEDTQRDNIRAGWRLSEVSITVNAGATTVTVPSGYEELVGYGMQLSEQASQPYGMWKAATESQTLETTVFFYDSRDWNGIVERGFSVAQRPQFIIRQPTGSYRFASPVDATGTLRIWARREVEQMSGDSDTPILPTRYHKLISWRAVLRYAERTGLDANRYQSAAANVERLTEEMVFEYDPNIRPCVTFFGV